MPLAAAAILLLLCFFSGCAGAVSEDTLPPATEPATETDAPAAEHVLFENGDFLFSFVRQSNLSDAAVTEVSAVFRKVKALGEGQMSYTDDFLMPGTEPDPEKPEILVGLTNRPETEGALDGLLSRDWFVGFVGNKLVVAGVTEEATLEAVSYFEGIVDWMSKSERVVFVGFEEPVIKRYDYPGKTASVAGTPVAKLPIVCSLSEDENARDAGSRLSAEIGRACGTVPSVFNPRDYTSGPAIFVGTSSERAKEIASTVSGSEWAITVENGCLYVSGVNSWSVKAGCLGLAADYIGKGTDLPDGTVIKGDSMGIQISERAAGSDLRIMTNNVWNCDKNKDAWIAMGEDCSAPVRAVGFARVYSAYMPDVINTQEMTALMLSSILRNLEKFGVKYKSLAINTPVADFTALIYNPETVTLEKSGHHVFDYGSDSSSKGYTWGLFRLNSSGKRFISLSTHMWWKGESAQPGSNAWRERQAAEIVEATKKLAEEYGCPVFVQGDFNTQTTTAAFAVFTNGGFSNCQKIAASTDNLRGYHSCSPTGYSKELSPGTYTANGIDHMLVRNLGDSKVIAFAHIIPDFYYPLSDHYPVYIDVKLN
ncbi:MAG: hypothetical protein J6V01_00660 [Clostridia bacterium]|nr:hypothetical protein [Clostridia bacterium]